MFIHSQTVDTIVTFCDQFNLNEEVTFSVLDTYTKYGKNIVRSIDMLRSREPQGIIETPPYTPQKHRPSIIKCINNNAASSILIIILLCTKHIEGPRSCKYIQLQQIKDLLQRSGTQITFDALKTYEFEVFAFIGYHIEQPKAYYAMRVAIQQCEIMLGYSTDKLQKLACNILFLTYLQRNSVYEILRPKVVPLLFEQLCGDRVLIGATATHTAIIFLERKNIRRQEQALQVIAQKLNFAHHVISTVSDTICSIISDHQNVWFQKKKKTAAGYRLDGTNMWIEFVARNKRMRIKNVNILFICSELYYELYRIFGSREWIIETIMSSARNLRPGSIKKKGSTHSLLAYGV